MKNPIWPEAGPFVRSLRCAHSPHPTDATRSHALISAEIARPQLQSGFINGLLALVLSGYLIAVSGCGDDDSVSGGFDTPFGNLPEVEAYRSSLNPVIDAVNEVQTEVQEQAVGSSNVATAENLNSVYTTVRPRLLEALVELDRIVPPPPLIPLHDDVRQLMVLRIDAQALVIEGFASGEGESMYAQAESKLAQANGLVVDLNARLCAVDQAINPGVSCGEGAVGVIR